MYPNVIGQSQSGEQERALLARLGQPRSLEIRSSDNPLGAIWRDLQRLEGVQQASRLFERTASEDSIKTFCAFIELADSYAAVAEEAETSLDPLLMYYAAMWLARGVIAVKLGIPAAELVKAHGAKPLPAAAGSFTLLGGTVTFARNGTLPRLAESLGGDRTEGVEFGLLELLQALPEMDVVLRETQGLGTTALSTYVHPDILRASNSKVSHIQVDFPGASPDDVSSLPISPALEKRGAKVVAIPGATPVIWDSSAAVEEEIATLFMRTANGHFAESRIQGLYVPELVVYVAVLHALSEFTRYYPRKWLDAIARRDADYALIREFMHFAERKVPELALNELWQRTIVYRHA